MFDAAFVRIKRDSTAELAVRDLHQHLLADRMQSAMRYVERNGVETINVLRPQFWQYFRVATRLTGINGDIQATVLGTAQDKPAERRRVVYRLPGTGRYYFFVRRADLDRHYPDAATPATTPAAAAIPATTPAASMPPERRRGPPTTHDWLLIAGEIARRCIVAGRVKVPKNESSLARQVLRWLGDQNRGQPAESEMREAVKRICEALRKAAQK